MAHLFTLRESVAINAPIERCFLLSTHLAIVQDELGMRPTRTAKNSRTSGLIQNADNIRWKGWKFGIPVSHESLIEDFDPPRFFRDRMLSGRFKTFEHDHAFEDQGDGTTSLTDELRFTMPFGRFGDLAGAVLLAPHISTLMRRRFQRIKRLAESDNWQQYLDPSAVAKIPPCPSPNATSPSPPK